MEDRIGTCSLCGGPVVVPCMMVNPTPHCRRCGAIPVTPHGPVIPMQPPERPIRRTNWARWNIERMPRPAHLTYIEDGQPPTIQDDTGKLEAARHWERTGETLIRPID